MNDQLEEPLTVKEIVEAFSQMCPAKALGADDLPTTFFYKH